jgi:hypothetical protein
MIFIDRSIPKGVATALKAVREDVLWLEDRFPHNVPDHRWLPVVGAEGWLVVTRDKRIRHRRWERQAIVDYGVGCFCYIQGRDPTRWEYYKLFAATLDEMLHLFGETPRPFLFGIDANRQFRQIELPRSGNT